VAGNQSLPNNGNSLVYGCSITDGCVDWETTTQMLRSLANAVTKGRPEVTTQSEASFSELINYYKSIAID
jgi:hypothetical protein